MITINLQHPVIVSGQEYTKLNMRRPKVRDQIAAEKASGTDSDKEVQMFANLCEVSAEVIHELDLLDYTNLGKGYQSFLSLKPEG